MKNEGARAVLAMSPARKIYLFIRNAMLSMPFRGISPANRWCAPSALFPWEPSMSS